MPELDHLLLNAFPEAAVLALQGKIAAANQMARHYLPQLEEGAPLPPFLSPAGVAGAGTFTAGLSTYSFSSTHTEEGTLILFRPAPQTALTDAQLDGVLRQLRQFMGELLTELGALPGDGERNAFHKSFYRMFRLVDNLEMMRAADGAQGLSFHPAVIDLAGLCRQLADQAAPLLQEGGISLICDVPMASLLIPGDSQLLQRMVLELIANAARAGGQGEVAVRLRTQSGRALITVSDSGPAPTQRQLAAMLQQDSDRYIPAPGAGAGLGLSLVRHIVSLHQGSMLVDAGAGALRVILSLPTGPLDPRVTVKSPALQRDGGLSPLLVALSDVLPAGLFGQAGLD